MNEPPKIESPRPPKSPNLKGRENATEDSDTTILSQNNENVSWYLEWSEVEE